MFASNELAMARHLGPPHGDFHGGFLQVIHYILALHSEDATGIALFYLPFVETRTGSWGWHALVGRGAKAGGRDGGQEASGHEKICELHGCWLLDEEMMVVGCRAEDEIYTCV